MNLRKRALSMLLSAAMVCNMGFTPVLAYAATGDTPIGASSLCEHHLEHTKECGYTEGTAATPCTHEHTEACYTDELICGLSEEVVDSGSSSDAAHTHTQECYKLLCPHESKEHGTACGYLEEMAGTPCIYECLICNPTSDKPLDSGAVSTPSDAIKALTLWQFVDPENSLTENTLALPGVSIEQQASFEAIVALLPAALTGTATGAAEPATVDITGWVCESYQQDESGNWPISGTFTFAATLAEGYTAAPAPTVTVELGGAKLLIGETGDFTITGGTYGTSHKYETNTLTIMDSTALTISGTTTADKIVVQSGVTANITLDGVSIDVSSTENACAFEIAGSATCNLTLKETTNVFKSGANKSGLQVQAKDGDTASLVIAEESTGSLNATGGANSTGIGGSGIAESGYSGGNITINGGTVTATGKYKGAAGIGGARKGSGGTININGGTVTASGDEAGIGGGGWGNCRNVTITRGTVTANSGDYGAGIGGGQSSSGGTIKISGGIIIASAWSDGSGIGNAHKSSGANITISGGTVTANGGWEPTAKEGISGTFSTDTTGNAFIIANSISDQSGKANWNGVIFEGNAGAVYGTSVALTTDAEIPSGKTLEIESGKTLVVNKDVTLTNSGTINSSGTISGAITGNQPLYTVGDFIVTGGVKDTDYSYTSNTLTILKDTPLTISGTTNTDKLVVQDGVTANITLDGVDIQFKDGTGDNPGTCAFEIAGSATCNLTLKEGARNILKSGKKKTGLQVPAGATLVIDGTGSLNATGGTYGAGIGDGIGGTVKICGGVVVATGGTYGAAICGGTTTISGGTVMATGGFNGAGIGGTFSTGISGNAFIDTTSISDQSDKANWNGVIFEGNTGKVYGSPTLTTDAEIPSGKTLTVGRGKALIIDSGKALNNKGTIKKYGTITGNVTGNPPVEFVGTLTVTGGMEGTDYSYEDSILLILKNTPLTISGTITTDKIVVNSGVTANITLSSVGIDVNLTAAPCVFEFQRGETANITLDGVSIDVSTISHACAFEIPSGATVNLTLKDGSTNVLKSGWTKAGLQVPAGATLVIDGTGALNVTGGDNGAGIGGGERGAGGTITINGGTVTATGGSYGAGIGGGDFGNGGTTTISGGTVTATGGSWGVGIGGGDRGAAGTFSTGTSGNAFIDTTSISDQSDKANWNGVIFEGNTGKVYGTSVTLKTNATIPSEKTLEIESGKTLIVDTGVTLTNNGKINNSGTLTQNGTIDGSGTINVASSVVVSFSDSTVAYGEEVTITATARQKTKSRAASDSVDFYLGDVSTGKKLGTSAVTTSSGTVTATLTMTMQVWETSGASWAIDGNGNTITADFGGSTGLIANTGTNTMTVSKATRTISAPTMASKTDTTATLNAVTPSIGDGTVEYGYAITDNSSDINNWQTGLAFSGLNAGTTYYFFASVPDVTYYDGATSTSTKIVLDKTAQAKPTATIDYLKDSLTGLVGSVAYSITVGGVATDKTAQADGTLAIDSGWFGKTITIVKKGNNTSIADSEAQSLAIPAKPSAPTTALQIAKTKDGITITNTASYTGCEFSKDSSTWNSTGIFGGLTQATAYTISVRVKAVANTSFASGSKTVSVTTVAADGSTSLKPNESIPTGDGAGTITNDGDKVTIDKDKNPSTPDTVITPPSGGDVTVKDDGTVTVPPDGTITTGNGPTVTLPSGGTADKDGNVSGGTNGPIIVGDNTITPPAGGTVTTDKDGKTELPGGSTVTQPGGKPPVTVPEGGGTVGGDGNITGNSTVTSVSVAPAIVSIQVGNTQQITATVTGTNNPVQTVTWASSDSTVATVSASGLVTALASGTTAITATSTLDGSKKGTATVTVTPTPPPTTTYTVTFDGNGGTAALATMQTGTDGKLVSLPSATRSDYRFDGWFTVASAGTQIITSTVFVANTTVYAHWTYTGGGSTGGGSVVTPPATPDKPTPPTTVETGVSSKTDKDGNATATVPSKDVTNAIEKAQKAAKKNDTEKNGIAIVLNIKADKNAKSLEITLSEASVTALRNAKTMQFTINNGLATITFDLTALNALQGGEVKLTISKVDVKSLSAEAQKAIGNRPTFRFGVTVGGKAITDFKGGRIGLQMPYTRTTTEQAGNLCGVFVDKNGKVTWLENSSYDAITGTLLTSTTHFSIYGVGYKAITPTFTDTAKHWAKDDIDFVVARGLLTGTGGTTFAPDQSMTRGMFVTALGRLAGVDAKKYQSTKFTDVKADAYYAPYVAWANANNIANGTSDTVFTPNKAITRQEMAVMLVNYSKAIGYKLPSVHAEIVFTDSDSIGTWAKSAVKEMQMAGILMGKNGNKFDPTTTATRAEVSAMLRRYVELLVSAETAEGWAMNESGQWLYIEDGKRTTGKKTIDGKAYSFDQYGVTTALPPERKYLTYTVQTGDSFWSIARKHKVSMFELAAVNGKTIFSIIHVGDEMKIPN